jgi:hypothetical protein
VTEEASVFERETLAQWADRWWAMVSEDKEDLRALVERWHAGSPSGVAALAAQRISSPPPTAGLEITAPRVEAARLALQAAASADHAAQRAAGDLLERFDRACAARDHDSLAEILQGAWDGVPESLGAHAFPGFGTLCELLSDPPPLADDGQAVS